MKYQIAQYSLRGARLTNQDRVGFAERDNAVLLVVADGLGGHRGGEIAAEILVQTMLRAFQTVRQPRIERPSAFLALSILQAHAAIVARGKTKEEGDGNVPLEPRTTCVACLVQDGYAYWAHVGDSRLYHFRGDKLVLRTQDHTAVEEMRQEGLLSEQEMLEHPHKGHLLNCLGSSSKPSISLSGETALQNGDLLLLCSDGLWEAFAPEEMMSYLKSPALDAKVEEMLFAAVRKMRHACDNISALCLRWQEAKTTGAPIQGNAAVKINEQTLRKEAKHRAPPPKIAPKKPADIAHVADDDPHKSIKDRIKEIEEYLRKYESK